MRRSWIPAMLLMFALTTVSCAQPETQEPQPAAEPAPAAEVQDATVADPDHYKVDEGKENDHFRIVRINYGPGEESVMHHHPEHVAVFLTDLATEFRTPDGATETVEAKAGEHHYIPAGSHHPRLISDAPFEGVAIELKKPSPAAEGETGPDVIEADPEHYKVEFENERVRVLRVTYGAGEESAMHYHPEHAAVFLNDHHFVFTLPDGTTQEIHAKAGDTVLAPAGQHLPKNMGEEEAVVIVVEQK